MTRRTEGRKKRWKGERGLCLLRLRPEQAEGISPFGRGTAFGVGGSVVRHGLVAEEAGKELRRGLRLLGRDGTRGGGLLISRRRGGRFQPAVPQDSLSRRQGPVDLRAGRQSADPGRDSLGV